MARLTHANGVVVSVADAKADRLLATQSTAWAPVGSNAPKGNASREAWAEYADSLGVDYDDEAGRDDIKAAVEAATS